MLCDLNVHWPTSTVNVQQNMDQARKTAADLASMGFHVIAFNQTVEGKLSPNTPQTVSLDQPKDWKHDARAILTSRGLALHDTIQLLSRVTFVVEDQAQVTAIAQNDAWVKFFNLVAVTPTTEKLWMAACQTIDCDIISLDMSQRLPFVFKHSIVGEAIRRGIVFEIAYSAAFKDNTSKRNLISNATNLLRVTKGKNVILSSAAKTLLDARGPLDVVNLGCLFGLNQDSAKHCISTYGRTALLHAETRRNTFKATVASQPADTAHQSSLAFAVSGLGGDDDFVGMEDDSDEDGDGDDDDVADVMQLDPEDDADS